MKLAFSVSFKPNTFAFHNSLVNWGSNLEEQPRLVLKKISIFFPELGKTEKSSQSNIQKFQNLFVNWEKLGSTA